MSSYSASIQLSNGTLAVTRPYPAPKAVDDVVDNLSYTMREEGSAITSIGITVVVDDAADTTQDSVGTEPPSDGEHAAPDTAPSVTGPLSS